MKFDVLIILFYIFFCGLGAFFGASIGLGLSAAICFTLEIAADNTIFVVWPCVLALGGLGLFIGLAPAFACHLIYQFVFDNLLPTLFTFDFRTFHRQASSRSEAQQEVR